MAVFDRIPQKTIAEEFTHYAWMFGLVPIYFNTRNQAVAVRNWVPEWTLDAAHVLEEFVVRTILAMNPFFEYKGFAIKITGEISE